MDRIKLWALALTFMLVGQGAALAQFPNCIAAVDNEPLRPREDGTYPKDPANKYEGGRTIWSTNKLQIRVKRPGNPSVQFIAKGMNYQPTQIGGSADFPPFQDFFYENDVKTWNPLWDRDIETMRAMGVNSIRVYGTWKWEVGSTVIKDEEEDPKKRIGSESAAPFWKKLNFSAGDDKDSQNNKQFCLVNNSKQQNLIFQHATHIPFLDRLWNGGDRPIYMWIGIALDKNIVNSEHPEDKRNDLRQFYRHTAKWLAKKYGNHPAVIGFVVGNELGGPKEMSTSLFWDVVNDLHEVVKASAPDKLTMVTFHDTEDYNVKITDGDFKKMRGPQVYNLDVWGFNPYNNPAQDRNLFDRYRTTVVENCTNVDGDPCVKPLLYGEFGVPASTHKVRSDLNKLYPVGWTAPNFVFMKTPPAVQCLASTQLGPPPGSGSDGPLAEFKARESIAIEMPATGGAREYKMNARLAPFFADSGVKKGDALPAALQADFLREFWKVTEDHLADNDAPVGENKLSSGGYLFEWRDEYWKSRKVDGSTGEVWFQTASEEEDCPAANRCGVKPEQCRTGAANAVFPGGWGDEQWFGITGAKPKNRQAKDPVVGNNGKLRGGPDTLTPRAAILAVCKAYDGPGCGDDD